MFVLPSGKHLIYLWQISLLPGYKIIAFLFLWLHTPLLLYAQENIRSISHAGISGKLAPGILRLLQQKKAKSIQILATDSKAFSRMIAAIQPYVQVKQIAPDKPVFEVSGVNENIILQLASSPEVLFIDVAGRIPTEELSVDQADLSVNAITAVHSLFPDLHGEGKVISVKERPFDTSDIDLKGRIISDSPLVQTSSTHATTMATLIAGGGNSSLSGKGVAWKARLSSSDFTNLLPDNSQQMQQKGISIQNHSYGVAIENYYGLESYAYDQQTYQFPHLLHVFSAGNEGNGTSQDGTYAGIPNVANLTGQFKMSKNTLSVGAIDKMGRVGLLSSRGPAYDGRIKPELVAYGDGGTSEAAALVSGISALLQQSYQQKYSTLPPSSLVKAILINSADDVERPGIDFETGFGNADALGAIQTIQQNRFTIGTLTSGQKQELRVSVPDGIYELKVTLAWHEPEVAPNSPIALINDLDLEIVHVTSNTSWKPWVLSHFPHPDSLMLSAKRGSDHLNNIEQITLQAPEPGEYIIRVNAYSIATASQDFSLAYEWENGFKWIHPVSNGNLKGNEPNAIRWQWKGENQQAVLFYRSMGQPQWTEIDHVSLNQSFYSWNPPDTLTQVQLKLVSGNSTYLSDTVTVLKKQPLYMGYNCEQEVLLQWPAIKGATHYQLYRMGSMYLEPFRVVTDTLFLINKTENASTQYAISPFKENTLLGRSATLDYVTQGTGCYISSFLPESLVSDTVVLLLDLSSTYRLQTISLERWENGTYHSIQTLPAEAGLLTYQFIDPLPNAGRNIYRVRVQNTSNQSFYSQEEEVFYILASQLLVFPNPVRSGQPLSLVEAEDKAIVASFYDLQGRLIYSISESGMIKEIPTSKLQSGMYLMKVYTERGQILQTRIVVF